jgi:hypothetical protein
MGNNRLVRGGYIPNLHLGISSSETSFLLEVRGGSAFAHARGKYNQSEGDSLVDINKVISDSFQVIEDGTSGSGNYYQASPFLTYLTNNPDIITGLGWSLFPPVWTKYKRASNETPLHVLEQLAPPTRI